MASQLVPQISEALQAGQRVLRIAGPPENVRAEQLPLSALYPGVKAAHGGVLKLKNPFAGEGFRASVDYQQEGEWLTFYLAENGVLKLASDKGTSALR